MNQLEQEIVGMISAAGDSKAKAFEALKMVKESRYDEARELLAQARGTQNPDKAHHCRNE